jgi:hypothetical protein
MANTKLLGLQTDNHLNWKNHIEQKIPKLSGTWYQYNICFYYYYCQLLHNNPIYSDSSW